MKLPKRADNCFPGAPLGTFSLPFSTRSPSLTPLLPVSPWVPPEQRTGTAPGTFPCWEQAAGLSDTAQFRPLAFWTQCVPSLSLYCRWRISWHSGELQFSEHSMAKDTLGHPTAKVPCTGGATDVPAVLCLLLKLELWTGKTGAEKGEENKGLWTKEERSSSEEKAKRTQREEEKKQSSSSILCYLEEPKAPEPSLLQEYLGRIVAGSGNASIESPASVATLTHSTCATCLPVSLPPLSHFHLNLQRPAFALENPQAASMTPGANYRPGDPRRDEESGLCVLRLTPS